MANETAAKILSTRVVHQGWSTFLLAEVRLADGTEVTREIERHGDAVAVLPYDPDRAVATLVRLMRSPVLYAADEPALIEAMAGLIDDGETPEESARREAEEETGLRLASLELVAKAWASPGISTERLSLFLAPYGPGDRVGPGGGAEGEHEGISVLEHPLHALWSMAESGEIADLKTLALLMALKLRRPSLFAPPAA